MQEDEGDADADRGDDAVLDQAVDGEEPARRQVVAARQPQHPGEQRVVDEHEGHGRRGRGDHGRPSSRPHVTSTPSRANAARTDHAASPLSTTLAMLKLWMNHG